jgi:hypothetical protein
VCARTGFGTQKKRYCLLSGASEVVTAAQRESHELVVATFQVIESCGDLLESAEVAPIESV